MTAADPIDSALFRLGEIAAAGATVYSALSARALWRRVFERAMDQDDSQLAIVAARECLRLDTTLRALGIQM